MIKNTLKMFYNVILMIFISYCYQYAVCMSDVSIQEYSDSLKVILQTIINEMQHFSIKTIIFEVVSKYKPLITNPKLILY